MSYAKGVHTCALMGPIVSHLAVLEQQPPPCAPCLLLAPAGQSAGSKHSFRNQSGLQRALRRTRTVTTPFEDCTDAPRLHTPMRRSIATYVGRPGQPAATAAPLTPPLPAPASLSPSPLPHLPSRSPPLPSPVPLSHGPQQLFCKNTGTTIISGFDLIMRDRMQRLSRQEDTSMQPATPGSDDTFREVDLPWTSSRSCSNERTSAAGSSARSSAIVGRNCVAILSNKAV